MPKQQLFGESTGQESRESRLCSPQTYMDGDFTQWASGHHWRTGGNSVVTDGLWGQIQMNVEAGEAHRAADAR